jgi:alpha-tubulin suppressor-like RCC1 family protein
VVAGLGETAQLALGQRHACALDRGGAVRCWGSNELGQLGIGRGLAAVAKPTPVPGLDGVAQLAATVDNTCALTRDHRVLCWGDNQNGQSAARDGQPESTIWSPRELAIARGATRLAAGESTLCAIGDAGAITCWGYVRGVLDPGRADAKVEDIDDAQAIALGDDHGCALRRGGDVWCFGENEHGQLGNPTIGATRQRPRKVDLPGAVTAVVAAGWDTCARLADRRWMCWGANLHGEIGPRDVTPAPMGGAPATLATPHPTPTPLDLSRVH